MRRILFSLLLFPFCLFSKESVIPAFEGEPSSIVHGCVDVITGAFFQNETDMIVEGPESIQLTRSYNSWDDYPDPTTGSGWRFNIPTTFHSPSLSNKVYVTENSGSLVEYLLSNRKERNRRMGSFVQSADWKVDPTIALTNTGSGFIGSETNRKNNQIHFFRETKKKSSVDFTNSLGDKTHFYLHEYPEETRYVWPVEYIQRRNGNRLNIFLHKGNVIKQLLASNPSTREVFGKADFLHPSRDLIEVKGSNGQWVKYKFRFHGGQKYLAAVESSHQAPVSYEYGVPAGSTYRIINVKRPNGQKLELSYYQMHMTRVTEFGWFNIRSPDDFRVGRVYSLTGLKDGKRIVLYAFRYLQEADGSGSTLVIDSKGNHTQYFYSKEKRLTRIDYRKKGGSLKSETFYWGEGVDKGNLISRCTHNDKGEVVLCQTYSYDPFGNVLKKKDLWKSHR
ncbi:hypothetical protein SCG7109_AE_00140 [Chlamydiales bacterium SCGC AG-110-M15]|nr:hypothetical protein SCG7109_AE_00140 [Chlamydiales bacterium SCGC AG-110-M15]